MRMRRTRFKVRRRMTAAMSRPEVKHLDIAAIDIPVSICDPTGSQPDASLSLTSGSGNKLLIDIFQYIEQGVQSRQRVGQQIFVKSINLRMNFRYCPNSFYVNTTYGGYIPGSGALGLRVVWADNREALTVSTPDFFSDIPPGAAYWSAVMKRLNRRKLNVWSDKFFKRSIGSDGATSVGAIPNFKNNMPQFIPAMDINYTIPVNKRIVYDDTVPKDEKMVYTMNVFACPPNCVNLVSTVPANSELMKQFYCVNYNVRIYYTDV